jgi:benzoate membrane transport protein
MILIVLAAGFLVCLFQGLLDFSGFDLALAAPSYTAPEFSWSPLVSVGVPLARKTHQ